MANWFDQVTKTLADEKFGRRQALKMIAGAAVAAYLPGSAFAKMSKCKSCAHPGSCLGSYPNCGGNSNCFCFTRISNGTGVCACNEYCSTATACANDSGCAKGYKCITLTSCGCSSGICAQCCTKTCVLSSSSSGRTAA